MTTELASAISAGLYHERVTAQQRTSFVTFLRIDQVQVLEAARARFPGVPDDELITRALWQMMPAKEVA